MPASVPSFVPTGDPPIVHDDGRAAVYQGDALAALRCLPESSIECVVTDPPYGLSKHTRQDVRECLAAWLDGKPYIPRASGGFGGRAWDAWVPGPEVWEECLRVLRPGGHLLAFAGTRTMDLLSLSIRLAGFELRDAIGYADGAPLAAWTYSTGFPKSLNIDCAIDDRLGVVREVVGRETVAHDIRGGSYVGDRRGSYERDITIPTSDEAKRWSGWGTALKPGWEPILLARKPLDGTVAETVLAHGCGGINVHGCRVGGRWPSNVVLDGGLPDSAIHCPKASTKERGGCEHPTIKPVKLMRHLVRLVCPPGGIVLDPFAGSGTTLEAAVAEGFFTIGIERDERWIPDIVRRIGRARPDKPMPPAVQTPAVLQPPAPILPKPSKAIRSGKGTLEISGASAAALKDLRERRGETTTQAFNECMDALERHLAAGGSLDFQ